MRHLLLALPVILLPLSYSQAQDDHHHHDHEHASSLGAHEHGAARLDVALDGDRLELAFNSPAINLLGFEHAPASEADEARIASARAQLERPHGLFGLPSAAGCTVSEQRLAGELLGASHAGYQRQDRQGHDHDEASAQQHGGHSDIEAHYQFDCSHPEALRTLELWGLFERFPGTEKIQVQVIGPNGQQGAELTPAQPRLSL
ncbi:DUF2796 domain-containing protein [Pseudomonas lopnurensis]|uniref:DUF2796 domain-containing protein n=1 Tax=Pseudomonas lopnurensis TaxID=1477517 RepID=UPI0018797B8A|nr:DUF2796 domain-containing protein [Pseudomonas lopnurensis]MBE7376417.1 DUF2796 domain-containing protein [Pseudomonas lopnurensis]